MTARERLAIPEGTGRTTEPAAYRLSVAPMMDCTDRHCRFLHRQFTKRSLLYTEMISASAVVHGDCDRLLAFHEMEHPIALQLGGSGLGELEEAASIASRKGFDEINLNAGCPSGRVQSGCFGAILMTMPETAAACVDALLQGANGTEVTVKCRIGVDDMDPNQALPDFIEAISSKGIRRITVHARKALLQGLNPKQNRTVPPLDYDLVFRMKQIFPDLTICINGGVQNLRHASELLDQGIDGVMIGRAAYKSPLDVLLPVDRAIFGEDSEADVWEIMENMFSYMDEQAGMGVEAYSIARHMLGLFAGEPGSRKWRQVLSDRRLMRSKGTLAVRDAARTFRPTGRGEDGQRSLAVV